jgi:hypothetical protein
MVERYSAGVELRRGLDRGRKGKGDVLLLVEFTEKISCHVLRTATQHLMNSMLDFSNTMHYTTLLGQGVDSKLVPNRAVGSVTESLAGSPARCTISI